MAGAEGLEPPGPALEAGRLPINERAHKDGLILSLYAQYALYTIYKTF